MNLNNLLGMDLQDGLRYLESLNLQVDCSYTSPSVLMSSDFFRIVRINQDMNNRIKIVAAREIVRKTNEN